MSHNLSWILHKQLKTKNIGTSQKSMYTTLKLSSLSYISNTAITKVVKSLQCTKAEEIHYFDTDGLLFSTAFNSSKNITCG